MFSVRSTGAATNHLQFIDDGDIEAISQILTFLANDTQVRGGCDLFTTKSVGKEKRFYRTLGHHLDQLVKDLDSRHYVAPSEHTTSRRQSVPAHAVLKPQFKPNKKLRSYLSGTTLRPVVEGEVTRTPPQHSPVQPASLLNTSPKLIPPLTFDPLKDPLSRKIFCFIVGILNVCYPDNDFSMLEPSNIQLALLEEIASNVNSTLLMNTEGDQGAGTTLWETINAHMDLDECIFLRVQPGLDTTFLVEEREGSDELALRVLWLYLYFIYSKRRKRVAYFWLYGYVGPTVVPVPRPRGMSITLDDLYGRSEEEYDLTNWADQLVFEEDAIDV